MQRHSEIGESILERVETYADVALVVRHHHERIDGEGYPDGIPGEMIPLLSKIIAVADAYNAMTSDRPYRDAMPSRVARLRLGSGGRESVRYVGGRGVRGDTCRCGRGVPHGQAGGLRADQR